VSNLSYVRVNFKRERKKMQRKPLVYLLLAMFLISILAIYMKTPHVSASPTVDGVIGPGEYDGGIAVKLIGRTDPSWNVDAYIIWDTEYLYVAVNESVPATINHQSWIEFAIDAGPARTQLDAFVLFDDHTLWYDTYQKPSGPWVGAGTGNFLAVSNVATEFSFKYTDYGITLGDMIKMSIDRNMGPPPPAPYGFAAFWPQNAIVYDGSPNQADPTTWGDVYLSTSVPTRYELTVNSTPVSGISYTAGVQPAVTGTPILLYNGSYTITVPSQTTVGTNVYNFVHWEDGSTDPVRTIDLQSNTTLTATYSKAGHVVDGLISSGEYDTGVAVKLIGRTDPTWNVDAYVDWDTEFLYVAVNESVPATTGHQSWIEFAIDAGPARTQLDAFVLFDDGVHSYVTYQKPHGHWTSQGPGNFLAASNVATEFRINYTDYGIGLGDTIKMEIDRNMGPPPPLPYGFAAFWPQNAIVYDGAPDQADTTTWADLYLATRDVAVTKAFSVKTVVGLGYSSNVNLTLSNLGGITETFNTTVYANQTIIGTPVETTLTGGSSTTIVLVWDTTGLSYGDFVISAVADVVLGETNTANNIYTSSVLVHVGVPADLSGPTMGTYDKIVNMRDIAYLVSLYNTKSSSGHWMPNADVNNDGVVNMRDIAIGVAYFNKHE
jgi:hypothetical protein